LFIVNLLLQTGEVLQLFVIPVNAGIQAELNGRLAGSPPARG